MAQPDFPKAQRIIYLISRYIDGTIDFAELQELDSWRKEKPGNEVLFKELIDKQNQDQAISEMQSYDTKGSLEKIKQTIQKNKAKRKVIPLLWQKLLAVACITVLIGVLIFFYNEHTKIDPNVLLKPHPQYIPPGTNKAILTLADGRKINIDSSTKGIIAREEGSNVQNVDEGKIIYSDTGAPESNTMLVYNTIETPRAGRYKVQLPDGTNVWLNSASSLHYPIAFNGKTRDVELTGEAYFEVAKDKHKPFTVTSAGQKVTVLGTHFNINAYKDESNINTTLLEGSVRVNSNDKQALLKPGEQSALSGETIRVSKANIHLATAWKDGQLAFAHTDLKSVLRQTSRWYNIDVEYIGKVPDISISGDVSMDADLSTMLKMLQFYNVHFVQQGRKLIITH
jgi:ferric-dicitrate binding protein FerR (iron transport regulator)